MRALIAPVALTLLSTSLWACSGDDATDGGIADAGPADTGAADSGADPVDSGVADTGADPVDAGTPDSGVGDMNDGFDEALDARKNTDNGRRASIGAPGDRDYFFFEGTAGEVVLVFTDSAVLGDGNRVDTVLRLYDAAENQVAENDDAVPRVDVDSEIIYRLPADGRYYVEVIEFSDWNGDTPEGRNDFAYTLQVRTFNARNTGINVETEAGNDAMSAQAVELNANDAAFVAGTFADANDVDVFAYTLPASFDGQRLQVQFMPAGADGYGSTTPPGAVWLSDTMGNILARLDLSGEVTALGPPVSAGEYLLWVTHPGSGGGDNDFYVFKSFNFGDNDPEVEPNDTRQTAEARAFTMRDQQMDFANFVLATLPDGDEDFFTFGVSPATESVTVVCGSATAGSGIQGLTVELLESDGTVVATATEPADDLARISEQTVTSTSVVVRLSKTGQDPEVSGDFVRCGMFRQPR